jgi:hypothetical protein
MANENTLQSRMQRVMTEPTLEAFIAAAVPLSCEMGKLAAEAKRPVITARIEVERQAKIAHLEKFVARENVRNFDVSLEEAVEHKLTHECDAYETSFFAILYRKWLDL